MRLVLEHGVDPNRMTPWSYSALHQAVKRDNSMQMIELLVEHGANPSLPNTAGPRPQWRRTADAVPRSSCFSNEVRQLSPATR